MADFLFQPQRLNVAVTRPRSKLILVGSHHMLKADEIVPEHKETMDMLRDLDRQLPDHHPAQRGYQRVKATRKQIANYYRLLISIMLK